MIVSGEAIAEMKCENAAIIGMGSVTKCQDADAFCYIYSGYNIYCFPKPKSK